MKQFKWIIPTIALIVCLLSGCNEKKTPPAIHDEAIISTTADTVVEAKNDTEEITASLHVHAFDEWATVVEPTCTADGMQERVCDCGEKDVETIPSTGHTDAIDAAVEPTCTETGLTEGKHCSVCGDILVAQTTVPAKGHTEVIDAAVEATCTETGLTEGKHCSVCGDILVAQTTVPAKGHTEVIDAAVEATCTETGLTEGKHCSACNKILISQSVVGALAHTYYRDEIIAPTESTEGYTIHICHCGSTITDSYLPALASVGLEYRIEYNRVIGYMCVITGIGTCTDADIVIPSRIDDYPVKVIGEKAFYNANHIKTIRTPSTVNIIEKAAFSDCDNLLRVELPNVTRIEDSAFFDCDNLIQVEMPKITGIGDSAFCRCVKLNNIAFPDCLERIDVWAFGVCTNLETVIIPYAVSSIGPHAFEACGKITIFCEIDSRPFGWSEDWNFLNYDGSLCQTIWNYVGENDTTIRHTFGEWYVEKEETETDGKVMRRDCLCCEQYETYTFEKIKVFYGVSSSSNLVDANGLSIKYINYKAETTTVVAGTDEYIYYYSPAEYGDCIFFIGGFRGGFTFLGQHSVDGMDYNIYRTDYPNLGTITFHVV